MLLNKRIPINFIFGKIKFEFIAITIFSFLIGYLDEQFVFISIPLAAPTILGTAISLLLAFRTAQAYDRWWEARIIWGSIVNNSRNLIREVQTCFRVTTNTTIQDFARRQIAWSYILGQSLRGEELTTTLKEHLNTDELTYVQKQKNIPNAILDLHAQEIKIAFENQSINEFQQIQLLSTINKLCDCMGMCERIKNTIFPRTYSTQIHLLIYVFAAMLPFSLTDYPPFVEEILNIIISSAFFLIENTAIYKQDPFEGRPTDTPVTSIARTIEINLKQMINSQDNIPQPLETKSYFLM